MKIKTDIFSALLTLKRRIHSGGNQIIPTFVGWVIDLFRIETFQTVLRILSPIPFSTVNETKHRSTYLSKSSNMKYTHITVDVGATEKYYKAI